MEYKFNIKNTFKKSGNLARLQNVLFELGYAVKPVFNMSTINWTPDGIVHVSEKTF